MKVVQVGIGGMGNAWLNTVKESDEVEFVGFVEVNPEIVVQQVERHNLDPARIFASLAAALDSMQPDAVINVTPPQFHKEVSCFALEAGLPVLSEKPLAGTLSDAQAIVDIANRTGVLHMVAQNYRYSVPVQTLKRTLDEGSFGKVGAVTVDFFKGPHFGGFRERMQYPLIIDMAIHHFDLMRYFLNTDPSSVFGRSWNPPWSWFDGDASASVLLEFSGGAVVSYNGSWCSNGQETPWNGNWRLECEYGVVTLHDDQVYVERAPARSVDTRNPAGHDSRHRIAPIDVPRQAQAYLLHEFYEAVTKGVLPATTCQDNIKSLAIVFDTITSFESGHPVLSSI
jgi:predicted dehydrogenase